MFTLCIPTMDRFDKFLYKNLKKYIENPLIEEIIVTDENGNDYNKILKSDLKLEKLKLFKNNQRLGPFLNKLLCCMKSKNKWISLIDSDNFAPLEYFEVAKKYIEENKLSDLSILMPSWARPEFDYRPLIGMVFKRGKFKENREEEIRRNNNGVLCCMNTGNFIINKKLIDIINLEKEMENIKKSPSCDVIYFNTLLFEQTDLEFHIVKDLEYDHTRHDGSIYHATQHMFRKFNNDIHDRYRMLK